MTRRQLIPAGVFLAALVLAFLLQDVVERVIIVPLVYVWWLLGVYYSILPQSVLWIVLVVVAALSAITALMPRFGNREFFQPTMRPPKGQIEGMVEWLEKSQRGGSYYKWLVANRLGKTAREILAQRDGQPISKKFGRLDGRDWNPPQKIDDYLESGLNGSFADYPRPRFWEKLKSTPLDADPKQVIEYLEDEMKTGK
ncbi:MAG: hypothetical protein HY865_19020 [Chloroflexi bacterium]|nr:hypothetical protein [Chloroflexota bacterium]